MEYLQYIHDIKRKLLDDWCFKPYYKWNTFNTIATTKKGFKFPIVLNLIINGIPSILVEHENDLKEIKSVLNLIINGIPSILRRL